MPRAGRGRVGREQDLAGGPADATVAVAGSGGDGDDAGGGGDGCGDWASDMKRSRTRQPEPSPPTGGVADRVNGRHPCPARKTHSAFHTPAATATEAATATRWHVVVNFSLVPHPLRRRNCRSRPSSFLRVPWRRTPALATRRRRRCRRSEVAGEHAVGLVREVEERHAGVAVLVRAPEDRNCTPSRS